MKKMDVRYLGIDVSKGYADFCLLGLDKQLIEEVFQLDDNRQGHDILIQFLNKQSTEGYGIRCALESTGGYEMNWFRLLKGLSKKSNIEVFKLNPKGVKHQIESTLKRTINDGVSAQGIAEYLINNYDQYQNQWNKSNDQQEDSYTQTHFYKLIMSLIKHQTARYNQLEKLLYQNFPELLIFCKSGIPEWMIRLLKAYPGLSAISRAQTRGINAIKGISRTKAEKIKLLAKESVSVPTDIFEQAMIKTLAEDIEYHVKKIDQLKEFLIESVQDVQIELISSMRGIAQWTAAVIFLMIGDVRRFENADQIASFFGVHPRYKQSGDGKWGVRMSKQGNAAMRAILYIAANNVILHDPYFKALYHHYMSQGKKRKAVIGIIMHKLLRVIYGMLKSQRPFDHSIDQANQKQSENQNTNDLNGKKRRYQELKTDVPISRSNYKKRRAELECQISTEDINTASSESTPVQI